MEEKLETREKIIEAAYMCFSEKGYLGTKTKEIAKSARVSEVTLFRYFRTKLTLFEAVIKHYSILPDLEKIASEEDGRSLEEILKYIAEQIYLTLRKKKRLIRILLSEITNHPNEISEVYNSFLNEVDSIFLKIFENKKKEVQLREDLNLKLAVRGFHCMLFSSFQSNEIFLKRELSKEEIKDSVDTFVKVFLDGIKKEEKK